MACPRPVDGGRSGRAEANMDATDKVEMLGPDGFVLVDACDVAAAEQRGMWRRDRLPKAQAAPGPAIAGRTTSPAAVTIPAPHTPRTE